MSNSRKFGFAVAAIFKNEAHIIAEWIDYYILQGATTILLCDDASSDAGPDLVRAAARAHPDISINLIETEPGPDQSSQRWFLQTLERTSRSYSEEWLLVCDLDEFAYFRRNPALTLAQVLESLADADVSAIQIPWILFGSNDHESTPPSAVNAFTRRLDYNGIIEWDADNRTHRYGSLASKYIVRIRRISALHIHSVDVTCGSVISPFHPYHQHAHLTEENLDQVGIAINHYQFQSRHFWSSVKCQRGDSDNWNIGPYSRTIETFEVANRFCNRISDFTIFQAAGIAPRTGGIASGAPGRGDIHA